MGLFSTGEVTKLTIVSYTDNTFAPDKKNGDPFVVMVNPETITRNKTLNYGDSSATSGNKEGLFISNSPEDFSINILLDSSGVIKDASLLSIAITNPFDPGQPAEVSAQVTQLLAMCCDVNGDEHRPFFVQLIWGDEAGFFKGVLTSYKIDYKLFRPDGKPIRAVVTLNFREAKSAAATVAEQHSPDITHKRIFKSHDHFTLMGNKIYSDLNYYIDVAKANGMLSFRRIEQGTELFFPPLK